MFVYNNDVEPREVSPGCRRKVLAYSDNLMVVELSFEAGAQGAMHSHPHDQATYILSGAFSFTIGDETKTVRAGDSMHQPPDVPHGCKCLEAGMLIDIFTPKRDDFL